LCSLAPRRAAAAQSPLAIVRNLFYREVSVIPHAYNPPVLLTKSVLLQRCADLVRLGHYRYITGIVPYARAAALVRKFRDLYLIHLSKDSRYRRKKAGLGNAHLLLWQHDQAALELIFVLFVTDGDHAAHALERLSDARVQRLTITGYELSRHTRVGTSKPTWSWKMSETTYQGWRDRVRSAMRSREDLLLRQAWYSLHRVPGFAPIRQQAKKIEALMRGEHKRVRHGPFPFPYTRIRYIQRLAVLSKPLSAVLAEPSVRPGTMSATESFADLYTSCPQQRKGHE
jgi:hypothetical protein